MIEIEEMGEKEMKRVLERVGYGHLGVVRDNRPYVVPIHYNYDEPHIYFYTTEGMKTEYISQNPEVCLQVEEVNDSKNWRSVIAWGKAERLTEEAEIEKAMKFILERNPTLTPALNLMWIDTWGRALVKAVYRIDPHIISGRMTLPEGETRGAPSDNQNKSTIKN